MQRSAMLNNKGAQHQQVARRAQAPFTSVRCRATASSNGNGHAAAATTVKLPTPAQTARTIVDISAEGTLCSISACGVPIGVPVSYSVDKTGAVKVQLDALALEKANLKASPSCSLTVQPTAMPARSVAAVTLVGKVDVGAAGPNAELPLALEKCLYFGGLDQSQHGQEVSAEEYTAAEPDPLRKHAAELVSGWNNDRAEDIYRIVSEHLKVPLTEMSYVELLWVDALGMYVRCEINGKEPAVLRVPFFRAVLDERDARSVMTMAAQLAWERERAYNPPVPSIFTDAAAAVAANN